MENKFGMSSVRKCNSDEQIMLKTQFQNMSHLFQRKQNEGIYWVNIFLNGKFCWQITQNERQLHKWVEKLVFQIEKCHSQKILVYGFLNSPRGHKKYQDFHFDYRKSVKTLFIPFVHLTHENSPQFLASEMNSQPTENNVNGYSRYGSTEIQLLERQKADCLIISQAISKPFVILKMQSGTVHRGIGNSTEKDRIVFFVHYSEEDFTIQNQKPIDNN